MTGRESRGEKKRAFNSKHIDWAGVVGVRGQYYVASPILASVMRHEEHRAR